MIQELKLEYKIINNVYSGIEDTEKHIFILTPERALKLLADNANLSIDFFFFDEVYKIDEDFDRNEDSNEKEGEEDVKQDNGIIFACKKCERVLFGWPVFKFKSSKKRNANFP